MAVSAKVHKVDTGGSVTATGLLLSGIIKEQLASEIKVSDCGLRLVFVNAAWKLIQLGFHFPPLRTVSHPECWKLSTLIKAVPHRQCNSEWKSVCYGDYRRL